MPRRFLFRLLSTAAPVGDHVPDSELLRRFAHDRDPAAFELLVHRHADAVWAACRRLLRVEADAEDAFQASFLVLARKAGSVRGPCVGGWLYRVAVNAALKLRERSARVATADRLDAVPAASSDDPDVELAGAIQEEVARLPERYRLPVLLCDLEGRTHAEAAEVLGWPVGSVSGRLSRAHALLRDRLTRRGFAPIVVAVLPAGALPTGTVRAAVAAASGGAVIHPSISILTEGVLSAMRTAKLKLMAAVVVSVGLLGLGGVGTVLAWPRAGQPAAAIPKLDPLVNTAAPVQPDRPIEGNWIPKKPGDPIPTAFPDLKPPVPMREGELAKVCPQLFGESAFPIEPKDDTYRRLLKARLYQGIQEIQRFHQRWDSGQFALTDRGPYGRSLEDVREVTIELWANDPKSLIPRLEGLVILAKDWERIALSRFQVGTDPPHELNPAHRHRLAAEAVLWKAKNGKLGGR